MDINAVGVSSPLRRWRIAYHMICSCRALRSLVAKQFTVIHRNRSNVAIDVEGGDSAPSAFSKVEDIGSLRTLVKERRLEDLHDLGGSAGLVRKLGSDAEAGIHGVAADLISRRVAFGSNTYPRSKPKCFFHFVFEAISDLFIVNLMACAAVSLVFGSKEHGAKKGWYDEARIFLVVFPVSAVSAVSNFRQMKRFEKLSAECDNIRASIVRGGRRQYVSIIDIVVGDVVTLNIGDQVPADGVFLRGHSLQVDESSMTGESRPVDVDAVNSPFLTSGGKIIDGYASMLVTAVGTDTMWGETMSSITSETAEPTSLQERLQRLTSSIGNIGIVIAALIFAVLLFRYFTGSTKGNDGRPKFNKHNTSASDAISGLVHIFHDTVTIIVVAIPEGLPLAVTLTLAFSMKRMMKDNAMVRRLSACETMGSVTTICTDKTGTLTLNQMKVTQFWIGNEKCPPATSISLGILALLHQAVGLNTTGSVYRPNAGAEAEITGSPTEKALLSWSISDLGMCIDETKKKCAVVRVEAFNSEKKRSGILVEEKAGGATITHWKGAAEMLLVRCSHYADGNGSVKHIDSETKSKLEAIVHDMAASSLRCIAFAYKNTAGTEDSEVNHGEAPRFDDSELTLLGLIGLKDPCRPEVARAINACRSAGVEVKMITGDNVFTAKAIAVECGIIKPEDWDALVVEGQEFRNYSPEDRMKKADRIRVMARSSPFDKLLMVQCLKQRGQVVAVTGDGTNDAPALKEADVGLAMGIQGTEVAKESSDIVILDDNFDTVVKVAALVTLNVAALVGLAMGAVRLQQHPEVPTVPADVERRRPGDQLRVRCGHRRRAADDRAALVGEPDNGHVGGAGSGHRHAHQGADGKAAGGAEGATDHRRHVAQPDGAGSVPVGGAAAVPFPRKVAAGPNRSGEQHDDLQHLRALPSLQRVQREEAGEEERVPGDAPEQAVLRHRGGDGGAAGADGGAPEEVRGHGEVGMGPVGDLRRRRGGLVADWVAREVSASGRESMAPTFDFHPRLTWLISPASTDQIKID